ncbi:MAG: hypothetical protein FJ100_07225 [Deltaproteobacteria bacterium]|nr:hypothetical protein [Deltaproteobacteria bacterium]
MFNYPRGVLHRDIKPDRALAIFVSVTVVYPVLFVARAMVGLGTGKQ